jgi:hypothetical protein
VIVASFQEVSDTGGVGHRVAPRGPARLERVSDTGGVGHRVAPRGPARLERVSGTSDVVRHLLGSTA